MKLMCMHDCTSLYLSYVGFLNQILFQFYVGFAYPIELRLEECLLELLVGLPLVLLMQTAWL